MQLQVLDHDIIRLIGCLHVSHLDLPRLEVRGWPVVAQRWRGRLGRGGARPDICLRQTLWKVSSCSPCGSVRAHDSAALFLSWDNNILLLRTGMDWVFHDDGDDSYLLRPETIQNSRC